MFVYWYRALPLLILWPNNIHDIYLVIRTLYNSRWTTLRLYRKYKQMMHISRWCKFIYIHSLKKKHDPAETCMLWFLHDFITDIFNCYKYRYWYIVHHNDVIMGAIASQITSLTIVYSTVYSDADQRKHQSRVTGLCAGNSPGTVPGEFPAQMTSSAENVFIWWRRHELAQSYSYYGVWHTFIWHTFENDFQLYIFRFSSHKLPNMGGVYVMYVKYLCNLHQMLSTAWFSKVYKAVGSHIWSQCQAYSHQWNLIWIT